MSWTLLSDLPELICSCVYIYRKTFFTKSCWTCHSSDHHEVVMMTTLPVGNHVFVDLSEQGLSALQTKTNTFANSIDQDETARNEPFHQDLNCLPFFS